MTQQPITVKDSMNLKVMHLNLHIRPSNCLRNVRIKTLSELTKFDEHSLMSLRTIGKKSITEIESNLHILGLKFKMTEQDWEIWTLEHEALIKKLMLDERIDMLNNLRNILFFIENNSGEIIGLNEYMYMCEDFTKSWLEPVLAQMKIPVLKDEELWKVLHDLNSIYSLPVEMNPQIKELLIASYGGINYEGKIRKLMEFRSQIIDIYINKEMEQNKMKTIKEVMNIKIENFDFSVRSTNCLKRAGIVTLSQLTSIDSDLLSNMKNFGEKSMGEIISKLQSLELSFNMTEKDWVEWGLRHIPLIKQL